MHSCLSFPATGGRRHDDGLQARHLEAPERFVPSAAGVLFGVSTACATRMGGVRDACVMLSDAMAELRKLVLMPSTLVIDIDCHHRAITQPFFCSVCTRGTKRLGTSAPQGYHMISTKLCATSYY